MITPYKGIGRLARCGRVGGEYAVKATATIRRRNGKLHEQEYAHGVPTIPFAKLGPTEGTGTCVRFLPSKANLY